LRGGGPHRILDHPRPSFLSSLNAPRRQECYMQVITILNHGTANDSTSGRNLVISRLEQWMVGVKGTGSTRWMINQGVGSLQNTAERQHSLYGWDTLGGILWARGIDKNVDKSVAFAASWAKAYGAANLTVNLAGHSRGSITAFKIANELQRNPETNGCHTNIFAIDPVPGNLGWVNNNAYKRIALEGNVRNTFMILAESERRNCFRAYIDRVFLQDLPMHRMDTIPGNHGGINELDSAEHESADVVLDHAVKFLSAHGTEFNHSPNTLKSDSQLLELYSEIMMKFQSYKDQGAKRNNKGFLAMGWASSGDRQVQTLQEDRSLRLGRNIPLLEKNKYRGREMKGLQGLVSQSAECRFFANSDHKSIFHRLHPNSWGYLRLLELGYNQATLDAMLSDRACHAEFFAMGNSARNHFNHWVDARTG
jgi:hypothetical protein